MSGMVGIVNKQERHIGAVLKCMLDAMAHRGAHGAGFVIADSYGYGEDLCEIAMLDASGRVGMGQLNLSKKEHPQPVRSADGKLSLLLDGEIFNSSAPSGQRDASDAEALVGQLAGGYPGDLSSAVQQLLGNLDGVFALAVTDQEQTVIARDKMGIRQLYFCERNGQVAFATEKKSLFALEGPGAHIRRLRPGHLLTVSPNGSDLVEYWSLEAVRPKERIDDMSQAVSAYNRVIREAVRKRVSGRDRVGIIYSGGIDSLLIAYLVKQMGVPFTCYTVGREGAPDIDWARSTAMELDFPIKIKVITLDDIEKLLPEIITTIEDHSFNQVEAATAMFAANRMAKEAGEHTVFTGQAADEIFGGYPWYPAVIEKDGYDRFEQYAWDDFAVGYKETFERENKIASTHGLDMCVPYADPQVVEIAFKISPELKIGPNSTSKKRAHREYALSIGIPKRIAMRKKEAAQHGANVHGAFIELAQKNGISEEMLRKVGYDQDITVTEKLGSSSRYGYRYGDEDLWKPESFVQYYLDVKAAKLGFLPPEAARHLEEVTQRLIGGAP